MNLARFPRRRYIDGPTPIHELKHLSQLLGGPNLFMKRDDLLGLAAGGNKIRKLEFVVAEALAQGADTLITCGAVQSNHCRLTLAAAVREGLKCRLVLEERVPGSYNPKASGNNFLFHLMGVEEIKVVPGGSDMTAQMESVAESLAAAGRKGYIIPGGASTPLGALGYVSCAEEILSQTFDMGLRIDRVICASGSAGTHSGLLVGFWGNNSNIPVTGINVSRTREAQEAIVHDLAGRTAALLGVRETLPRSAVECFGDYVGPGYSLPTSGMVEAVKILARTEAILMDPVYLIRKGRFQPGENILFVHTGGSPALYAYAEILTD
jgi:D-cysteine desulfhydrase